MTLYRKKKIEKRVQRCCLRLETRESCEPVTVHKTGRSDCGSHSFMLFLHGTVLHTKQTVNLNGSSFSRSDCMVRSRFQNLDFHPNQTHTYLQEKHTSLLSQMSSLFVFFFQFRMVLQGVHASKQFTCNLLFFSHYYTPAFLNFHQVFHS